MEPKDAIDLWLHLISQSFAFISRLAHAHGHARDRVRVRRWFISLAVSRQQAFNTSTVQCHSNLPAEQHQSIRFSPSIPPPETRSRQIADYNTGNHSRTTHINMATLSTTSPDLSSTSRKSPSSIPTKAHKANNAPPSPRLLLHRIDHQPRHRRPNRHRSAPHRQQRSRQLASRPPLHGSGPPHPVRHDSHRLRRAVNHRPGRPG